METRGLEKLAAAVLVLVAIEGLWSPVVLLLARLAPGFFASTVTPVASTVDVAQGIFAIATVVVFAVWIHRAGSNLVNAGFDDLEFTPGSRIWWFAVPFANLVMPYKGMRELWNASRGEPYDLNQPLLIAWWVMWLVNSVLTNLGMRMNDATLTWLGAASDVVLAVLASLLVRGITRGQQTLGAPRLAEVFA